MGNWVALGCEDLTWEVNWPHFVALGVGLDCIPTDEAP
jgi:hypothetical protein